MDKKTEYQDYTIEKDEVSVEIDLKGLVGDLAKNREVREAFYQVAIDKLNDRLDSGRNYKNMLYPGKAKEYSKEYKDSLDYKAFNKSGTVNMQLTDAMRSSIELAKQNESTIKIAVGEDQARKAFGHMSGFEGHPTIKGMPKREWFGWTDKELKEIAREFKPLKNEPKAVTDDKVLRLLDRLLGDE
jgi:phage gpG-like protein